MKQNLGYIKIDRKMLKTRIKLHMSMHVGFSKKSHSLLTDTIASILSMRIKGKRYSGKERDIPKFGYGLRESHY